MSIKTKNTIKKEWDLSLLYKSVKDPQIEKDIALAEKAYSSFAKKYKNDRNKYTAQKDSFIQGIIKKAEKG